MMCPLSIVVTLLTAPEGALQWVEVAPPPGVEVTLAPPARIYELPPEETERFLRLAERVVARTGWAARWERQVVVAAPEPVLEHLGKIVQSLRAMEKEEERVVPSAAAHTSARLREAIAASIETLELRYRDFPAASVKSLSETERVVTQKLSVGPAPFDELIRFAQTLGDRDEGVAVTSADLRMRRNRNGDEGWVGAFEFQRYEAPEPTGVAVGQLSAAAFGEATESIRRTLKSAGAPVEVQGFHLRFPAAGAAEQGALKSSVHLTTSDANANVRIEEAFRGPASLFLARIDARPASNASYKLAAQLQLKGDALERLRKE